MVVVWPLNFKLKLHTRKTLSHRDGRHGECLTCATEGRCDQQQPGAGTPPPRHHSHLHPPGAVPLPVAAAHLQSVQVLGARAPGPHRTGSCSSWDDRQGALPVPPGPPGGPGPRPLLGRWTPGFGDGPRDGGRLRVRVLPLGRCRLQGLRGPAGAAARLAQRSGPRGLHWHWDRGHQGSTGLGYRMCSGTSWSPVQHMGLKLTCGA